MLQDCSGDWHCVPFFQIRKVEIHGENAPDHWVSWGWNWTKCRIQDVAQAWLRPQVCGCISGNEPTRQTECYLLGHISQSQSFCSRPKQAPTVALIQPQLCLVILSALRLLWWLRWEESACNAGEQGLIPGLGRVSGERNGNSFQYSCLESSMDRGAWWAVVHGFAELDTTERLTHSYIHTISS